MILIIDNYDSFVYNLACYVERLGEQPDVRRNDAVTVEEIEALSPTAIIISPGPGKPTDAGISIDLIRSLGHKTPILGVCLGHQAISEAYGGTTIKAEKPMHGKSDIITHDSTGLFQDLPNPLTVGRYHSLTTDIANAQTLEIMAQNKSGKIMAIKHAVNPVFGVQFHPESILTPNGITIIKNFITLAKKYHTQHNAQP